MAHSTTMLDKRSLWLPLLLAVALNCGQAEAKKLLRGGSPSIPQGKQACLTVSQCRQTYDAMTNTEGWFYVDRSEDMDEFPTKGCFVKGANGFFGTDGTVEEMSTTGLSGTKERIWCDALATAEATEVVDTATEGPTAKPVTVKPVTGSPTTEAPVTASPTKRPSLKPVVVTDSPTKAATDSPSKQPTPTIVTQSPTTAGQTSQSTTKPPTVAVAETDTSTESTTTTAVAQTSTTPASSPSSPMSKSPTVVEQQSVDPLLEEAAVSMSMNLSEDDEPTMEEAAMSMSMDDESTESTESTEGAAAASTDSPTKRPSLSPVTSNPTTAAPVTPAPTTLICGLSPPDRAALLRTLALTITPASILSDPTSPQSRALSWLIHDDTLQPPSCPSDGPCGALQRYVMAAFYFATGGGTWEQCNAPANDNNAMVVAIADEGCGRTVTPFAGVGNRIGATETAAWLTPVDECMWGGVACRATNDDRNGCIDQIDFENDGLSGTLLPELHAISQLRFLLLEQGTTSGPIPSEYGLFEKLLIFDMDYNQLSGSIPDAFFDMKALQQLDLNDNNLGGTISSNIGSLNTLTYLQLDHNEFSGSIPSEVGELTNLRIAFFQENDLTGAMPAAVCANRNTTGPAGLLNTLEADCNPPNDPKVECACCSWCNNGGTGSGGEAV